MTGSPRDHPRLCAARVRISTIGRHAGVGGSIGAIVGGIRIGGDVHPEAVAELRAALLRHKVVFLRDQQHATDGDQLPSRGYCGASHEAAPDGVRRRQACCPSTRSRARPTAGHTDVTFVDRDPGD